MKSQIVHRPFLSAFFEARRAADADACGTGTVTKTSREGGDADEVMWKRSHVNDDLLGTRTLTEAREDADSDAPPIREDTKAVTLGTKTQTATREESDLDAPEATAVRATNQETGTKTSTRARENGDADAAVRQEVFWTAGII